MLTFDLTKEKDVCAFGRASIDLYAAQIGPLEETTVFNRYLGGSPANTAVAMANLGLQVGYIGRVSDDQFGRFIVHYMADKGIDVSHIVYDKNGAKSGLSFCEQREKGKGVGAFMYRTGCADLQIDCTQIDSDYLASFRMLLLSGTSLSHSPAREAALLAIAYAKRSNVRVVLDLDYREGTWDNADQPSVYFTMAAAQADIVMGTREEFDVMEYLYMPNNRDDNVSASALFDQGVSMVCIKHGVNGSTVYTADGAVYHGGIYPTAVYNTFGAGDSYSGAFNYCLLKGQNIAQALRSAAASASFTVARPSCSDAMPKREQVEDIIKNNQYQEK